MEEREVLLVVDRYALVVIHGKYLTNYIVACGYNSIDGTWGQGVYFNADSDNQTEKVLCLMNATEYLYSRLNEDYITMDRMIEIATRFKDELELWSNIEDAMEFIDGDVHLTDNEKKFFNLYKEKEDK